MLGQMVRVFSEAVLARKSPGAIETHELFDCIRDHLMDLPNPGALQPENEGQRKFRKKCLFKMTEIRNNCAHPNPFPDALEQGQTAWEYLAGNPGDAFLRYFIGAHLPG